MVQQWPLRAPDLMTLSGCSLYAQRTVHSNGCLRDMTLHMKRREVVDLICLQAGTRQVVAASGVEVATPTPTLAALSVDYHHID